MSEWYIIGDIVSGKGEGIPDHVPLACSTTLDIDNASDIIKLNSGTSTPPAVVSVSSHQNCMHQFVWNQPVEYHLASASVKPVFRLLIDWIYFDKYSQARRVVARGSVSVPTKSGYHQINCAMAKSALSHADGLRFALLGELPPGADVNFSEKCGHVEIALTVVHSQIPLASRGNGVAC